MIIEIILVVAVLLCTSLATFTRDMVACNNSPNLCNRSYDSITHLGAHDSPFFSDVSPPSPAANQLFDSPTQLSAGVRLLSGQIHQATDGTWHLCHTYCELYDAGPLETWLASIKAWLDSNADDVVTLLIVNDGADTTTLDDIFQASGIASYAYTPPSSSSPPASGTWPSLASLIAANTRLIIFIQPLMSSINTVAPYLIDEFTFIWENQYLDLNTSSFSCAPNRPPSLTNSSATTAFSTGRLALLNHFLDEELIPGIDVPNEAQAPSTNAPLGSPNSSQGSLGMAAAACVAQWTRTPTFILVDWFNLGPAIDTVDALNRVVDPVGRSGPGAVSAPAATGPTTSQGMSETSSISDSTLVSSFPTPGTSSDALITPSTVVTPTPPVVTPITMTNAARKRYRRR